MGNTRRTRARLHPQQRKGSTVVHLDVSQPVLLYTGEEIKETNPATGAVEVVTLRTAIVTAINWQGPQEPVTPVHKDQVFAISMKLHASEDGIVELSVEECAFIKERSGVCQVSTSLAHGRICEAIEAARSTPEDVATAD